MCLFKLSPLLLRFIYHILFRYRRVWSIFGACEYGYHGTYSSYAPSLTIDISVCCYISKKNNVKNDVRSFLYGCYCCRCCCCFLSRRHSANFFMLNFSLFTRFILFGVRIVSHRIQLNKSFCRGVMLSDFGYGFPFQWILHTYCILLYYIVCIYLFFHFEIFFLLKRRTELQKFPSTMSA